MLQPVRCFLLALLASSIVNVRGRSSKVGCRFPDYLQTSLRSPRNGDVGDDGIELRREWRTHWREAIDDVIVDQRSSDGASSFSAAVVTFDGSVMRSSEETGPIFTNPEDDNSVKHYDGQSSNNTLPRHHHPSGFLYIRECLEVVYIGTETQRYLVAHRTPRDSDSSYFCIEFVVRSESLIQIRESPVIETPSTSICHNNRSLTWNPWPLIDVSQFFASFKRCPIEGGYNIRLYDRRRRLGVCDAYDGETRMESECGASPTTTGSDSATVASSTDGLVFRFRYDNCVPVGLRMRSTQRTLCAVSWTVGDDNGEQTTFVVLRHDSLERAWCFRFNSRSHSGVTTQADEFSGLLFVGGLRCDVGLVGTNTTTIDYVRIDMSRDTDDLHRRYRHPADKAGNVTMGFPNQLCIDDYEACSFWSEACETQTASSTMMMTCAKSCGQCVPSQRPAVCQGALPADVHGVWSEYKDNRVVRVSIIGDQFIIDQHRAFRCVRWNTEINSASNGSISTSAAESATRRRSILVNHHIPMDTWEHMFVTESPGTGCRPRYTCVQLKRRSNSVLHYRISQPEVSTWILHPSLTAECFDTGTTSYRQHITASTSRLSYVSKDQDKRDSVDCRLPRPVDFETEDPVSSISCFGRLAEQRQSNDILTLTMEHNCPNAIKRQKFRCLDSTLNEENEGSDLLIVSEMSSSSNHRSTMIVCWLFDHYHTQRGNVVYRLRAEDCHPGVGSRVTAGTVQPEAILVEVDRGGELVFGWRPTIITTTLPTTTTASSLSITENGQFTTVELQHGDVVNETLPGGQNDDDWSFLDGQEIISVYDEPDIVPLSNLDGDRSRGRYDVTGNKNGARQAGFASEVLIGKSLIITGMLLMHAFNSLTR